MTSTDDACTIRITRLYDAPVALVWDAWTDTAKVAQWWGPRGFTITTASKDLRPGGSWVYTMHGPDGTDWPNFTRYHEVVPQQRLVYDHGARAEDGAPMFRVTATFRDVGGRTEFVMDMTLPSPEAAQQTRGFIKAAGGNGTWDRLAEFLEVQQSAREIFVINRTLEAPIATVWDMWTTPAHLAAWLPPAGFAMTIRAGEIRVGSTVRFAMANDAFAMYGRHEYRALERPALIEYVQVFTDADGNDARHPGSPTWPHATRVRVELVAEGPAQTRITVRFDVEGDATPEEIATFVAERGGMTQGWSASFDVLDAVLAGADPDSGSAH